MLTRRRADLRRHAGEISFPGGRRDAEDADLTETALREAEEEIGLAREQVELIGELPPTSTFATNYVIHPFVGEDPGRDGAGGSRRARSTRCSSCRWSEMRAGRTRTQLRARGITFQTDAYVVDEHLIWGATARIIENLLSRLRDGGPPSAPRSLRVSHPARAGAQTRMQNALGVGRLEGDPRPQAAQHHHQRAEQRQPAPSRSDSETRSPAGVGGAIIR